MKINFTNKEYRLLLDIVYLGEWILNAHEVGENKENESYEKMIQKIYSYAKKMGCEELIVENKQLDKFYPAVIFEDGEVSNMLEAYNENTFWDELIAKLANRDFLESNKNQRNKEYDVEEFFDLIGPLEEKYYQEFEKNGLKNLKIEKV